LATRQFSLESYEKGHFPITGSGRQQAKTTGEAHRRDTMAAHAYLEVEQQTTALSGSGVPQHTISSIQCSTL